MMGSSYRQSLLTPSGKFSSAYEWNYHRIHVVLGVYCLWHFLHRFYRLFWLGEEDMGFTQLLLMHRNENVWKQFFLRLVPHLALQLSGLCFTNIPKVRYRDGFRIWPQYRWEALIFCGRSLALMILAFYRKTTCQDRNDGVSFFLCNAVIWPWAIVLLACVLADAVRHRYRSTRSRTLRDMRGIPPLLTYLAAAAQFHATVHSLCTHDRLSVQMAALSVIQVTAFGMTLRRKNVVRVWHGVVLYGLLLVVGMATIAIDWQRDGRLGMGLTFGNVAALVRFEWGLNKYVLWTVLAFALHSISKAPGDWTVIDKYEKDWRLAATSTFVLMFLCAARRQYVIERKSKVDRGR